MRTTLFTIASAYAICPFLAVPLYLATAIQDSTEILDANGQIYKANNSSNRLTLASTLPVGFKNVTVYKVQYSDIAMNNPGLVTFNLWMYSILIKLIPCFALTILSLRLIGALLEAKRRRKQLMNASGMQTLVNGKAIDSNPNRRNTKSLEKEKQTDRTTRMLLAVLLLFLITEFPQGILGLLGVVLGQTFMLQCYYKLGKSVIFLPFPISFPSFSLPLSFSLSLFTADVTHRSSHRFFYICFLFLTISWHCMCSKIHKKYERINAVSGGFRSGFARAHACLR